MNTQIQKTIESTERHIAHTHARTHVKQILVVCVCLEKCVPGPWFWKNKYCDRDFLANNKGISLSQRQRTVAIHMRTFPYRYLECNMLRRSCAWSDAKITKMAPPVQKNMPRNFLTQLHPLPQTSEPMTSPMTMVYTGIQASSKAALVAVVNRRPYIYVKQFTYTNCSAKSKS